MALPPAPRLMDLAKEMTKEALPIKCLEAVILGMYPSSALGRGSLTLGPSFLSGLQGPRNSLSRHLNLALK